MPSDTLGTAVDIARDFGYLYVLTLSAWAVVLSGWTITTGGTVSLMTFADRWFMSVVIAVVLLIPTAAYRWSKRTLP